MTHHVRRLIGTIAVLVAGIAGTAQGYTTGNLLTDPSFENNALIFFANIIAPPYTENAWGAENGSIVGAENAVTPADGSKMLRMLASGATSQAWQLINLNAYSTDINAGLATMDLQILFNVPATVAAGQSAQTLQFYDALHVQIGPLFQADSNTTYGSLDALANTWQPLNLTGIPIPVNTVYVLTQVYFGSVSIGLSPGYVDDAHLTLTAVPEPSSIALVALGLVGVGIGRARRRAA